jgi:hypothetical protein
MSIRCYGLPCLAVAFLSIALASSDALADPIANNHAALKGALPNNFRAPNDAGASATYSTDAFVDLQNYVAALEFEFTPQERSDLVACMEAL